MRGTELKELSIEVGGLTNLRILDNSGGKIRRIPPKVISKLHNLEELYIDGFRGWGSKVKGAGEETNARFDEVTTLSKLGVLTVVLLGVECLPKYVEQKMNLVKFNIYIGDCFDGFPSSDNSIEIDADTTISCLPEWFCNKIMKKAEFLHFGGCLRLIDLFVESEHGRLPRLKHLDISSPESAEVDLPIKRAPKTPVFENLEELYLSAVCAEFCLIEILPPGSLINLKVLSVNRWGNWGNILLPSTLLQRLLNLEELHLWWVDGAEYMFGYEPLLVLPQLKWKKIYLTNLDIKRICERPAPPAIFQTLQSLSITSCCMLLGSLFTYDVAQCLPQLNCLVLEYCLMLERIVEPSTKKTILPKLESLSLIKLPMLDYESATFDIECPSLEYLTLRDCPMFSVFLSDFHSWKQVQTQT